MCYIYIYSATEYIENHLDEFLERYVQDELVLNNQNNEIEFTDNQEDIVLPNEDAPLDEGKIAVKRVKFDIDVDNISEAEKIDDVTLTINHTGENLVPDEFDPEDSMNKYVKVRNIKIDTGGNIVSESDILDSMNVTIITTGSEVEPIGYNPTDSLNKYVMVKDIKVSTDGLYSKEEYDKSFDLGQNKGYFICKKEMEVYTINDITVKVTDFQNSQTTTVRAFPDPDKFPGKSYAANVFLDLAGLNKTNLLLQDLINYNVKDNCYENGFPKQNPFVIDPDEGYDGFKNVSLNLTGLFEDADGNEPNNASVQEVTGRTDNRIKHNQSFTFQNLNNNYTGWNNFIVDVQTPDNLYLSNIVADDELKEKVVGN